MSLLLDEIAIATARLAEAGIESPRTDAELIAAHGCTGYHGASCTWCRTRVLTRDSGTTSPAGRPASRCSTSLACLLPVPGASRRSGVFVPRQETEVMTGWAIEQLAAMDVAEPVVADLGTGSGAIALSIAQEVPRARGACCRGRPAGPAMGRAEHRQRRCRLAAHGGPGDTARGRFRVRADRP